MHAKGFVSSFDVGIDAGDDWGAAITTHEECIAEESKLSSCSLIDQHRDVSLILGYAIVQDPQAYVKDGARSGVCGELFQGHGYSQSPQFPANQNHSGLWRSLVGRLWGN